MSSSSSLYSYICYKTVKFVIFPQIPSKSLTEKVEGLKKEVKEKESIINKLESEYEVMNETIGSYLRHREMEGQDTDRRKPSKPEIKNDRDSLVFHGVQVQICSDSIELSSIIYGINEPASATS